jgi:3-hydroxyisobutyrate dehydrogenase
MGRWMCTHLIKEGHALRVHNRSPEKAQALVDLGAVRCSSPKEVAQGTDAVFCIVGYPADVREVILGPDGVLAGASRGALVVDMTTSDPSLAREIHTKAATLGIAALDAPVSGGDVGAREATLAIMVGGDRATYDTALPYFQHMGKNIAYLGSAGAGQHTKMCNQILIASTMIGVVESLLYATRAGLDPAAVIELVGKGAAASWSLNNLGPRIVKGNFEPGFYIKHFVKDMGIALDEARRMRMSLPGLALANQFYLAAMALGHENLGTHGLYKVLAGLNGMTGP